MSRRHHQAFVLYIIVPNCIHFSPLMQVLIKFASPFISDNARAYSTSEACIQPVRCYNGAWKILLHSTNICDIATKLVPLCSVSNMSSYEPSFSLLASVSVKLAYFSMLFILKLACTASTRINNMLKQANFGKNHASKLKLGLHDGVWYTEYNGANLMIVSQKMMQWHEFSIHLSNIWQTSAIPTHTKQGTLHALSMHCAETGAQCTKTSEIWHLEIPWTFQAICFDIQYIM